MATSSALEDFPEPPHSTEFMAGHFAGEKLNASIEALIQQGYHKEQIMAALHHLDEQWPIGDVLVSTAEASGWLSPLDVLTINAKRILDQIQWGGDIQCMENNARSSTRRGLPQELKVIGYHFDEPLPNQYTDVEIIGQMN